MYRGGGEGKLCRGLSECERSRGILFCRKKISLRFRGLPGYQQSASAAQGEAGGKMNHLLPLTLQPGFVAPRENVSVDPQLRKVLPQKAEPGLSSFQSDFDLRVNVGDVPEGASRRRVQFPKGFQSFFQAFGAPPGGVPYLFEIPLLQKEGVSIEKFQGVRRGILLAKKLKPQALLQISGEKPRRVHPRLKTGHKIFQPGGRHAEACCHVRNIPLKITPGIYP